MAFIKLFSYHYARHKRHVHLTVAGMLLVVAVVASAVHLVLPRDKVAHGAGDPSDAWSATTFVDAGAAKRINFSAVEINGIVYIHGGYDTVGSFNLTDVRAFNLTTRKWGYGGSNSSYATRGHSAVMIEYPPGSKKMYVFGGYSSLSSISNLRVFYPSTGAWFDLTADTVGRSFHSAVAMTDPNDGKTKMYVFGGQTNTTGYTNDLRIYDPSTATWTPGPSGGTKRIFHSAVAMTDPNDGKTKMYVFGGRTDTTSYDNTVSIYSPANNSWTTGTPDTVGGGRFSFSAVVLNNKMYVFGGWKSTGVVNDVRIYDPSGAGAWSAGAPDAQGGTQSGHKAVAANGLMWVVALDTMRVYGNSEPVAAFTATPTTGAVPLGVSFTNSSSDQDGTIVSWAWDFNGDTTIDSTVQNPPSYTYTRPGWYDVSLTVTDNKGFIIQTMKSGYITAGGSVPLDAWVQRKSGPSHFNDPAITVIGGKMHVVGGGTTGGCITDHAVYDPTTDSWSPRTGLFGSGICNASAVVIDGKLYVFGGVDGSQNPQSTLYIYNPGTDSWSLGTNAPVPETYHAAVALTDPIDGRIKMYVYVGWANNPDVGRLYIYDPIANNWTRGKDNTLANSDIYNSSAVVINGKMYLFGGASYFQGLGNYPSANLFIYDPVTTLWSTGATALNTRTVHSAVATNGKMYVYGGLVGNSYIPTASTEIYDPLTNQWTNGVGNFLQSTGRYSHGAAVIEGIMYAYGGNVGNILLFAFYGNHTPVSDFTATPTAGDPPLMVTFTDQSTDDQLDPTGVVSWSWDFDGNGTEDSTAQNPQYQYQLVGSYNVRLKVTDQGGKQHSKTKSQYIIVGQPPSAGALPVRLSVIKEVVTPADGIITSSGADVSYKITVTNWGTADAAQNYKITDILPPGFTNPRNFVGANPVAPVISGRKLIWDLAPAQNPLLKNGGQLVITYDATAP